MNHPIDAWATVCHFDNPAKAMPSLRPMTEKSLSKLSGGRPRKTYGLGRSCSADGCTTRLSSYNKNEYCWNHFQPIPRPARIPTPPTTS
jgi:hypothetical protein